MNTMSTTHATPPPRKRKRRKTADSREALRLRMLARMREIRRAHVESGAKLMTDDEIAEYLGRIRGYDRAR